MTDRKRLRHRSRWTMALRYSGLPIAVRAVGWALATWTDMGGLSRGGPRQKDLASAAGVSLASVKRHLDRLEVTGWLFRQAGPTGPGQVTAYQLTIPSAAEVALEAVLEKRGSPGELRSTPNGAHESQERGSNDDGTGLTVVARIEGTRARPVEPELQAGAGRRGAPAPWTWSGYSARAWFHELTASQREAILARYLAADPVLGDTDTASDLEAIAKEVTA